MFHRYIGVLADNSKMHSYHHITISSLYFPTKVQISRRTRLWQRMLI